MLTGSRGSVIVAGASSGIGGAAAVAVARTGREVILFSRRKAEVTKVAESIEKSGGRARVCVGDATVPEDVTNLAAMACDASGYVDALVNCVGMNIRDRSLHSLTSENWSSVLANNLDAAYNLTQGVLPVFRRQHDGLLIHVASRSIDQPDGSGASYQAAKAGVAALAYATSVEERGNGVRVTVICPGMTDTPLVLARPKKPTVEELAGALQPEDVASLVPLLLSLPKRSYVPKVSLYPTNI